MPSRSAETDIDLTRTSRTRSSQQVSAEEPFRNPSISGYPDAHGRVTIGLEEQVEQGQWTSREVAHNPPAKDRPSGSAARYVLTLFSRPPIRHAWSVPVSRLS